VADRRDRVDRRAGEGVVHLQERNGALEVAR
jgi:hypothetical protein